MRGIEFADEPTVDDIEQFLEILEGKQRHKWADDASKSNFAHQAHDAYSRIPRNKMTPVQIHTYDARFRNVFRLLQPKDSREKVVEPMRIVGVRSMTLEEMRRLIG